MVYIFVSAKAVSNGGIEQLCHYDSTWKTIDTSRTMLAHSYGTLIVSCYSVAKSRLDTIVLLSYFLCSTLLKMS
jgi:hypothetical protein